MKQDQIDYIVDDLPEEYNAFVMEIYGSMESPIICDVETLIYVQEAQLNELSQELDNIIHVPLITINLLSVLKLSNNNLGMF